MVDISWLYLIEIYINGVYRGLFLLLIVGINRF